MQFNIRAIGIASAMIAGATYVVCGLLVFAAPGATSSFLGWVLHVDLGSMARQISVTSFLGGLVLFSAFVGICTAATAWLYNRLKTPAMGDRA